MKLHNTLSRDIEQIQPLEKGKIKLYTCGLTVYSQPHIGNWVGYIYWDVLVRTLEELGFEVDRVQNITDVGHLVSDDDNGEDKMEKGARTEGKTAWEIAEKYIKIANYEGYELLRLKRPRLIRATDCIEQQINFVEELEKKGYTYIINDEGVYFDTSKIDDYGKLARLDIDGLEAGSRVAFKNKNNVTDFALWKFSPKNQTRDMEWESPWGKGFPGWHLECSVIAHENLGEQIDIHAGGVDHIPIHHTNEIAQTEALTGKPFVNIWLHNNHLKIDAKKMAKSEGNVYTLNDLLNRNFEIDSFKLLVLSKNYHTEGNFTWDILEAAQNRLNNWKASADTIWQLPENPQDISSELLDILSQNLNTPEALKLIDQYFDSSEKNKISPNKNSLKSIEELLGLDIKSTDISNEQKLLLSERSKARDSKKWDISDKIRLELHDLGLEIRDEVNTQIWMKSR